MTEREREVLTLIGRGLSNAELAGHLGISLAAVKTHVGRLLTKLAVRDRAQLASSPTKPAWSGRAAHAERVVLPESAWMAGPLRG